VSPNVPLHTHGTVPQVVTKFFNNHAKVNSFILTLGFLVVAVLTAFAYYVWVEGAPFRLAALAAVVLWPVGVFFAMNVQALRGMRWQTTPVLTANLLVCASAFLAVVGTVGYYVRWDLAFFILWVRVLATPSPPLLL
jgi:hypothetical protein